MRGGRDERTDRFRKRADGGGCGGDADRSSCCYIAGDLAAWLRDVSVLVSPQQSELPFIHYFVAMRRGCSLAR